MGHIRVCIYSWPQLRSEMEYVRALSCRPTFVSVKWKDSAGAVFLRFFFSFIFPPPAPPVLFRIQTGYQCPGTRESSPTGGKKTIFSLLMFRGRRRKKYRPRDRTIIQYSRVVWPWSPGNTVRLDATRKAKTMTTITMHGNDVCPSSQ